MLKYTLISIKISIVSLVLFVRSLVRIKIGTLPASVDAVGKRCYRQSYSAEAG